MRAAVLERRGADGVSWRDFPDPIPAPGESVLKVAASSLNRVDLYMRDSGVGITHALPQVMGVEAAGQIVEAAATAQIFEHPQHPYTRGLIDAFPSVTGPRKELVGIPGSPPRTSDRPARQVCDPMTSPRPRVFASCCARLQRYSVMR